MEFNIIQNEIKIVEIYVFEIIRIANNSSTFFRTKFVFREDNELDKV
jgi:hypothetical protein